MKKKNAYIFGFVFLVISVIFTFTVKTVDVGISTETPGYNIGFSALNNSFHSLTGVNMCFYDITGIMGIISICLGLFVALLGLIQLIKRKSFARVDRSIYCLGGVYAILGALYIGFEKVIINYRPIIMDGEVSPEASFPSSHTLLICTIIATAVIEANRRFADKKTLKTIINISGSLYIITAVVLRLFSGVHWFTDILASVLISASITFFFYAVSKEEKGKHSI